MKEKKVFANGICFFKLFLIFIIFSILGAYYEETMFFCKKIIRHLPLVWEYKRGLIYGPFSPVYGFGAVIMTITLAKKERPWWKIFIYASLLGGLVEFGISYLQETFLGTISWDYSTKFLNIQGRTTVGIMMVWGLMGVIFVKIIYPKISEWIEKIPYNIGKVITIILVILMSLDCFISAAALFRQTLRDNHYPAFTELGRFCDKHYPDEFLRKRYNNMKFTKRY